MTQRLLTPVLFLVTCVAAIISSLGAPLVPLVSEDLHVSLSDAQWSLTAALLMGAVAAPLLGRLGDGPHRRAALMGGLGVVGLGGVLAALSGSSLLLLIVGRTLQGVGLGLIPLAMAAARDALPAEKVTPAVALLSVAAAAGVGAGYPISGLIATNLGLDAAYWFGAAFALVALLAVLWVVPASTTSTPQPIEPAGALLLSGGLVALLLAIGQGEAWGWASGRIVGLLVAALVLLAAWARRELRTEHPLVELRLLRHRAVLTADAAAFVLGIAMYIDLSVITSFVQTPEAEGYGFSASVLTAGLCLVPFSVASLVATRLLPQAVRLVGQDRLLPAGCLVVASAGAFFALEHGSLWHALIATALLGVGLGYTFATIPGLIVRSVPEHETGSAMGFYQVVRYIGFSLGSAVAAAVLAAHTAGGAARPDVAGFTTALWLGAAVCVAAAGMSWLLPRGGHLHAPADEDAFERLEEDDAELAVAGLAGGEERVAA